MALSNDQTSNGGKQISVKVINKGIGGNNTTQGLARFDKDVVGIHPSVVVLYFGMNDAVNSMNSVPVEKYRENLSAMIARARAAGITPVLMTITPVIESYVLARHKKEYFENDPPNAKVKRYNDVIKSIAAEQLLKLVDLNAIFVSRGEPSEGASSLLKNKANLKAPDGVHYTPEGYRAVAESAFAVVRELVKKGDTVVCLGDSLTFGAGAKGAGAVDGETYPAVLFRLLNH
ncbi:MAG: hypothetical protein HZC28_05745 [Spirochaetes bacterium]|nr:hypothetical protein [Spirochaetota bacterium]